MGHSGGAEWLSESCSGGCGEVVSVPAEHTGTGVCARCGGTPKEQLPAAARARAVEALAGYLLPGDLEELVPVLEKVAERRHRRGKTVASVEKLRDLLDETGRRWPR